MTTITPVQEHETERVPLAGFLAEGADRMADHPRVTGGGMIRLLAQPETVELPAGHAVMEWGDLVPALEANGVRWCHPCRDAGEWEFAAVTTSPHVWMGFDGRPVPRGDWTHLCPGCLDMVVMGWTELLAWDDYIHDIEDGADAVAEGWTEADWNGLI